MDLAVTSSGMSEVITGEAALRRRGVVRVMAVTSGKGGVGKTNAVINLAVALSQMDKRVLILDAALGLGNIDINLGLTPKYNIGHLLRGERTLEEVMLTGPAGVMILPAASGAEEFTNLGTRERHALYSYLEPLEDRIDIMLIDTGSGISDNVLFFNMAAQDVIVVASPDPASIRDAHALMGILLRRHDVRGFRLLVNKVRSPKEGLDVYRELSALADGLQNASIDYIGCVPKDQNMVKAARQRRAVVEAYPGSRAARCFGEIAGAISETPAETGLKGGLSFFWRRTVNAGI